MPFTYPDATTIIADIADFSPAATFECGQCFRWSADASGVYTGTALGRVITVYTEGSRVTVKSPLGTDGLREYLDADTDYAAIRQHVAHGEFMSRAAEYGAGIRILRQDPWEALCSFIISQRNSIPNIKRVVERLCAAYGDALPGGGNDFPQPERIAVLSEADLAPLKTGYRSKYIIAAARLVASGEIDLTALKQLPQDEAVAALTAIPGVGLKVATCAALYGLHMTNVFPVDTWMKKALRDRFDSEFDFSAFSPYAGVAQQYIFHYERALAKGVAQ